MKDHCLIFLRGKGTGRINQGPAGTQHRSGFLQNLFLAGSAPVHVFHAPVQQRFLFFAEHPLTGTGGINDDPVKKDRKPGGQPLRRLICHYSVSDTHALNICGQDPCPVRMDLIRHQKPPAPERRGQLCALPPGSRAQIQYPFSRLRPAEHCRSHGARLLDIIHTCFMPGEPTRPPFFRIIKAVLFPGNRNKARCV